MNGKSQSGEARRRVVIVGGGLAGLAAAEALARGSHGLDVCLLEAKRNTGGRAGSFTDPSSGQSVDYCQHVAMGCCTNLLALLDRCGLSDSMQRYDELQFLHPDHPPSRFAASRFLPPPLHLHAAITSLKYLTAAQKRKIRGALFRLIRTTGDSLRSLSAADWLRQQRQDAESIRLFWDVILVSALGEQTDVVSMSAARKVFVDGFAAARGASDVLVPNRPLSELFGSALPAAIEKLGVRICTGSTVKSLRCHADAVTIETSDNRSWIADHLISAVPWHGVDRMLQQLDLSLGPFATCDAAPITGVHLWWDREITQRPHAVMVGTLAQWLFRNPTQPAFSPSSEREHYYQVVISGSHQQRGLPHSQLVAAVIDELKHAFPLAQDANLIRSRVVTDPKSVFSLTPEFERMRPLARTPLPWFHLAGDWIATGWPATMEGAVISGRMAAASVQQSERLAPSAIDPGLPRGWLAKRLIKSGNNLA